MKKAVFFTSFITALASACSAEEANKKQITGQWLAGAKNHQIECPDLLEFHDDKRYTIINDCYGTDIRDPVTERGRWEEQENNEILFKNRDFESNYFFGGQIDDPLSIKVMTVSGDKLILQIEGASIEHYRKVSQ